MKEKWLYKNYRLEHLCQYDRMDTYCKQVKDEGVLEIFVKFYHVVTQKVLEIKIEITSQKLTLRKTEKTTTSIIAKFY